jgi:hypothetical protein
MQQAALSTSCDLTSDESRIQLISWLNYTNQVKTTYELVILCSWTLFVHHRGHHLGAGR